MKAVVQSTKLIELGSCAFRQWRATSHCRFIHGYQLKAKIWFSCSSLDDKGWAVDFGGLKDLKAELKSIYDHTTTVAADDPELETFKRLHDRGIIQLYIMEKGVGIERAAENVFEIASRHVQKITGGRCWVDKVEVFEHEENSATHSTVDKNTYNGSYNTIGGNTSAVLPANPISSSQMNIHNDTSTGAANVGPGPISNGMGNPFAGTSWGA